jgi:hypothetical protein
MSDQGWSGKLERIFICRVNMRQILALGAIFFVTSSYSVRADTRSDIMNAFNRCAVFSDDRTWLNCIYGAVQPMRSQLGLPPAPASQTNLVPSTMAIPQVAPALAPAPLPQPPPRQRSGGGGFFSFLGGQPILTNMPLADYSIRDGLFTITLANGEVWREVEESPAPHWRAPPSHYLASITKGALASYNLVIKGEGIQYKVQRVK